MSDHGLGQDAAGGTALPAPAREPARSPQAAAPRDRLRVMLIAAMTLCGRISPAVMGSPEDRRLLEEMRAATDAGLMGAGTLRVHDAEMRGPGGVLPAQRLRVLISAKGELPFAERKIFHSGPRPVIFTGADQVDALRRQAAGRAEIAALPTRGNQLDLHAACRHLVDRGVKKLLLEGGGVLNYQALAQGIVDELLVTITPKLSGDNRAAGLVSGEAPLGNPFLELELLACRPGSSGELFCHYRVKEQR